MKELVMHIVKALVDNPDEVTIEETLQEDEIILKGFNKDGDFSGAWHNSIGSIKKVDK